MTQNIKTMDQDTLEPSISFLAHQPKQEKASGWWWLCAGLASFAYLALNIVVGILKNSSVPELIGVTIGATIVPGIVVGLFTMWDIKRTQKRIVIACFAASFVFLLLSASTYVVKYGYVSLGTISAAEYKSRAIKCVQVRDSYCAKKNWEGYVNANPSDSIGLANLGMIENQRGEHVNAAEHFAKAISLGEGTYDLFAYYADSLAKLGRTEEAINWSYKALVALPRLVDVRGNLAKLLVSQKRNYEALTLLEQFDNYLESQGKPRYFEGQRIAIESSIKNSFPESAVKNQVALRVPKMQGHYFVPLTIGEARPVSFMVDTGATKTTISTTLLHRSKVDYRRIASGVRVKTADGREVSADIVELSSMRVGPFEMKNVSVFVCKSCASLLGQSTLAAFDMQALKPDGIEFLTLRLRDTVS